MGRNDLSRHFRLCDAEQDPDAFGRAKRQIEAGDRVSPQRPAKQLTGGRITSLEEPDDALLTDFAPQAERGRPATLPDARRLALPGVVVLALLGDAVDVVAAGARAGTQLAHVQHPVRPSR